MPQRLNAAAAIVCALALSVSVANAKPLRQQRIDCDNRFGCKTVVVDGSRSLSARRHHASNPVAGLLPCKHYLDCGCSLAVYLRITEPGLARRLWVARQWLREFPRASGPVPGAVAVLTRKGGGHVGIVRGVDANGNPIVESFKYHGSVGTATYPKRRVLGYVFVNGLASR